MLNWALVLGVMSSHDQWLLNSQSNRAAITHVPLSQQLAKIGSDTSSSRAPSVYSMRTDLQPPFRPLDITHTPASARASLPTRMLTRGACNLKTVHLYTGANGTLKVRYVHTSTHTLPVFTRPLRSHLHTWVGQRKGEMVG